MKNEISRLNHSALLKSSRGKEIQSDQYCAIVASLRAKKESGSKANHLVNSNAASLGLLGLRDADGQDTVFQLRVDTILVNAGGEAENARELAKRALRHPDFALGIPTPIVGRRQLRMLLLLLLLPCGQSFGLDCGLRDLVGMGVGVMLLAALDTGSAGLAVQEASGTCVGG